jgi:hypothetical protein
MRRSQFSLSCFEVVADNERRHPDPETRQHHPFGLVRGKLCCADPLGTAHSNFGVTGAHVSRAKSIHNAQ